MSNMVQVMSCKMTLGGGSDGEGEVKGCQLSGKLIHRCWNLE